MLGVGARQERGSTTGKFVEQARRIQGVPTFDEDLEWILARFVDRTFAQDGLLLCVRDDQPPFAMAAVGPIAGDAATQARLTDAIRHVPAERRRSAEAGPRARWSTIDERSRVLHVVLSGDPGERFAVAARYAADNGVAEGPATAVAERLVPVLEGYFRLWRRHRDERCRVDGLTAALDHMAVAVFVLDGGANLVFANAAGADMLDRANGVRAQDRSIAATDLKSALRFQVAIQHVLAGGEGGRQRSPVLLLPRGGARPLLCTVLPVAGPSRGSRAPAAIIYVLDPAAELDSVVAPVCQLYGLSPVETRLAVHLARGATLAEAAVHMRIKEQTARAYLKQVFGKVGANRQADLVRVLVTSMVPARGELDITPL